MSAPILPNPALPQVIVLDTCVLLSNLLRRWLLRLAELGCFQPAWSAVIGDEWQRNAARIWGVDSADLARQWLQLQHDFPQADQGDVQPYKAGLRYSDPKDWHVIAAARAALAGWPGSSVAVLTRNTRDFSRSELRRLGIDLFDPDAFFLRCWQHHPQYLHALIQDVAIHTASLGKAAEPADVMLKRERLFRLNRVYSKKL